MSPKGFSKRWLGPATKASNDIVIEQVTLFMRFSPIGDSLSHHIVPPLVNAAFMTVLVNALRSGFGIDPLLLHPLTDDVFLSPITQRP